MDTNKLLAYESRRANPVTSQLLFLFLGWSYGSFDKIGLQILFYITLGGFGLWTLIRLFTLNDAIKTYNSRIAEQVGLDKQEIATLKQFICGQQEERNLKSNIDKLKTYTMKLNNLN